MQLVPLYPTALTIVAGATLALPAEVGLSKLNPVDP
jgi:hypothetical protein